MNRYVTAGLLVGAGALTTVALQRWLRGHTSTTALRSANPSDLPESVVPVVTESIDVDTATQFVSTLASVTGPVTVLLHTLGGSFFPVLQMVRAIQRRDDVTAFVPYYALSGGTLVALACNRIQMWADASLGPVDPQLAAFPATTILQVRARKPTEALDDITLLLAEEAEKSIRETREIVAGLVPEQSTIERLVSGDSSHSFPISSTEARTLLGPERVVVIEPSADSRALVNGVVSRMKRHGCYQIRG